MTEPCDVTVGGATWLDQAQETAARTNQNAGPHRRKVGQQRAAPISQGEGRAGSRQQRRGNRQLQIHTGEGGLTRKLSTDSAKCPHRSREEEEKMQGEAWGCREEGLKQRGWPQPPGGTFII